MAIERLTSVMNYSKIINQGEGGIGMGLFKRFVTRDDYLEVLKYEWMSVDVLQYELGKKGRVNFFMSRKLRTLQEKGLIEFRFVPYGTSGTELQVRLTFDGLRAKQKISFVEFNADDFQAKELAEAFKKVSTVEEPFIVQVFLGNKTEEGTKAVFSVINDLRRASGHRGLEFEFLESDGEPGKKVLTYAALPLITDDE